MGSLSYAGWTTERMQQQVRTVFGKFVDPAVSWRLHVLEALRSLINNNLVHECNRFLMARSSHSRLSDATKRLRSGNVWYSTGPAAMSALSPLLGNCGRFACESHP